LRIGVISDTHALLRPEAIEALRGSDLIVHAGDVGARDVLDRLRDVAPMVAVRGNIDREPWAHVLPETRIVEAAGVKLFVLHDLSTLAVDPVTHGYAAVISGHSHTPVADTRNGVLYLNPGSAGPRRFRLPVTVARLTISTTGISHELVHLDGIAR
jgi:putative phosphoesterase